MSDSPEDDFSLVVRDASRVMSLGLRAFSQGFALVTRQASSLVGQEVTLMRVRGAASRRGLALGLPLAATGRPRRLDYADLTVMLAAGLSQSECARRLGVGRSAVSKALIRNRELRRRVNRLAHASDFMIRED